MGFVCGFVGLICGFVGFLIRPVRVSGFQKTDRRGGSRIFCDRVELRRSRNGNRGVRGRSPRKIF